jgi:hypothetical protein
VQISGPEVAPLDGGLREQAVTQQRTSDGPWQEGSAVSRLARFFPEASPVRICVTVSKDGGGDADSENTVIEFGTRSEALFACRLPLEFEDKITLRGADRFFEVEAYVVAVQYHRGQAAMAARFLQRTPHWVVKL